MNYNKLIDPSIIENWKTKTDKNSASLQEKLGITRAYLVAQNFMSPKHYQHLKNVMKTVQTLMKTLTGMLSGISTEHGD